MDGAAKYVATTASFTSLIAQDNRQRPSFRAADAE
jgi:hypothetical protein